MLIRHIVAIAFVASAATMVATVSPGSASLPAAEWPMYGANLANTRTVPGGPSPLSVPSMKVAWRIDVTDGDFTGTPVVSGGVAYVGSNGGVVRAIQAVATSGHPAGSVLWTHAVAAGVNSTLAVSGGSVFVPLARLAGPAVVALQAGTGAQQWSTVLDTSTDADLYGSPIPVTFGGRAMVLQGVSAVSGDPASPLRGSLTALDASSGAVIWKTYMVPPGFNGGAVWSTPAVDPVGGAVYVGTGNAYSGAAAPTTDSIVKLDLATGAILGHLQGTANDVFSSSTPGLDFDFGASPNLYSVGGHMVVGEGQKGGVYWAADASTMHPIWHTTIGVGSVVGGILGSTAYDPSTARVIGPESLPGYLWSVSAGNGALNWVGPGVLDLVHLSPVAVSNGVVYSVTTTGFLEAWLEATGTPLFAFPLNPIPPTNGYSLGLASGVSVADGLVIADLGSQGKNGSVVAFRGP